MTVNVGPRIAISVDELAGVMADFTSIRLYRASSLTGTYTLLTTITLVTGQPAYAYQDDTGAITSWYRHSWYNTSTTAESARSEPYPAQNAPVLSRQTLRQRVADRLGLYGRPRQHHTFPGSFTTTAAGSATTTVCSAFIGGRWPSTAFVDWYVAQIVASELTAEAQVASFASASGTFTHDTLGGSGIGSGGTFELYGELRAGEWNEMIDLSRDDVWMPFDFGIGGVAAQREYPLPYWVEDKRQFTGGSVQVGTVIREHVLDVGLQPMIDDRQGGGLLLRADIPTNQVWILHGFRQPPPFVLDADTLVLSESLQDQWLDAACMRACTRLFERASGLSVEDRRHWYERALYYAARLPKNPPWLTAHPLRPGVFAVVAGGRGGREVRKSAYY